MKNNISLPPIDPNMVGMKIQPLYHSPIQHDNGISFFIMIILCVLFVILAYGISRWLWSFSND